MQLKRAETLLDLRNTLLAGHLTNASQIRIFYRPELQQLRGIDFVTRFERELREDAAAVPRRWFHRFVSGHPGVGKSTELSRFAEALSKDFEMVRLNAQQELNPARFDPRDLIVALMKAAIQRAAEQLGKRKGPTAARAAIEEAFEWLGETTVKKTNKRTTGASGKAGIGPGADSWWAKALGLFGQAQAEARYEAERETSQVAYRLKPISEFLQHANSVFTACERACQRQFLFIVDNFEKPDFDSGSIRKLFVQNSSLLADLHVHYVFTMPIERANTEDIRRLQLYDNNISVIPDAPMFGRDAQPHRLGRDALRAVLESRTDLNLFARGQVERLVVASGGNIRDLFSLVLSSRDYALNTDANANRIEASHVSPAIDAMRANYQRKLYGDDDDVDTKATYTQKLNLLSAFFFQRPDAERGATFYSLLRARALQEFDDARIGVHPLIVDLLYNVGMLNDVDRSRRDLVTKRPFGCSI